MNPLTNVKNIQKMNERMLEMGVEDSHGWHKQYKDSAYIFIGGLPYDLTEGDILCVFSQYGEIVNINLVREKKTGKTKGFCFLCYEDQRSTVLAVDNFNGIKLGGRTIRVDHCSNYRRPLSDEKDEHGNRKEIVEVGCAPKTPPPSPPQSEEDDEILELPKKRKKEKKEKKQKKHKEGKNQKKRKTTSSSEEDNGKKKQKLDLSKNESSKFQSGRVQAIETNRHTRNVQDVSRDHSKRDLHVKTSREGEGDHDIERDDKRQRDTKYYSKGDHRYDSHGRNNNRGCEFHEHDRKRDFYQRDIGGAHDPTNRDNYDRSANDHRDQKDKSAYRTSRSDRSQEFDERRRDRFDKQRDYRADEGRAYERTNRNSYGDRRERR